MKQQNSSDISSVPRLPLQKRPVDTATLELLSKWTQEDATSNLEEIRAAELELSEFKKSMNENRAQSGESLLFP
jgi:hypothetical protein